MAESDSADGAVKESTNLKLKAREILATSSHEGVEFVVVQLSLRQETTEFQTALALYNFCAANFPNCLTLTLLKVYRCSSNGVVRFQSIYLLSETLAEFRNRGFELSLVALHEIKPLLISCLTMQETEESEIKILRRIVSFIAYDVMILDNGGWDELSDCILSLAINEPLNAFHVFIDLPPVYGKFIYRFMQKILEKAEKMLLNPEQCRVEDWTLALETVVKMGIQILDSEMRFDVIKNLLSVLVKSANKLVEKGMEQFLVRGLENLERFLSRDKNLYNYNKEQCLFVSAFMFKIKELGTHIKEAAAKINQLVKSSHNPAVKLSTSHRQQPQENQDHGAGFDREGFEHLNTLSSLEILRVFASTDVEERSRDMAIRRLNLILSDHTSKKVEIDISVMRELQPLLIYCLSKEGISESMFKVLGEVVYHVAYEMMNFQDETWYGLRDYIVSRSKTEFQRAVYIFQCLTMALEDEKFVIPVMENLLPEISTRLNPPRELLVDNNGWVLAFVGAFCSIIHLIEITSHAGFVKEIADKMIDSVRELVERGMEVGLVRRGLRDVESIVKKHLQWFGTSEYKFLKGLLWRLYAIKSMKWESKIVLWRINVVLERGVPELIKELPNSELDWLNQPEA